MTKLHLKLLASTQKLLRIYQPQHNRKISLPVRINSRRRNTLKNKNYQIKVVPKNNKMKQNRDLEFKLMPSQPEM